MNQTLSYEQARDELAEVVKRLEAGGLTLEQSLDLWERGERLAAICEQRVPTYHIEDAACIDPEAGAIRFRPEGAQAETRRDGWLPAGRLAIGITAGASTPNNKIGETIERIAATRGVSLETALG